MVRFRKHSTVLTVIILVFLFLSGASYAADSPALLQEVRSYIREYYYLPVNESILRHNSVEAIIQALGDPYTSYLSPEEYQEFLEGTTGSYAGVGMQMQLELFGDIAFPVVTATFDNTPARRAGLLPGDRITAVDGKDISGMALEDVVKLIKGKPGTRVSLTLSRGEGLPFTVDLTREQIELETVTFEMLEDDLGYIYVSQFVEDSGRKVRKAVKALMAQGAKGIILDLRDNPGGFLDSGLDMAEIFVPNGEAVVRYRTRRGMEVDNSNGFCIDVPLVVLVNGDSASASEIVAGAIKDHGTGTLVGTTTYGKGLVQTVLPLDSVRGAHLKFSIAEYFSPKLNQINVKGIAPDYYVEGRTEQLEMAKAVLREKMGQGPTSSGNLFLYPSSGESYMDGRNVAGNGKPFLNRGAVMVPLRLLGVFLEGNVTWNDAAKQAILEYGDSQAVISVGSDFALVGNEKVKLSSPVRVVDGRVYVPLRLLASFEGISVTWDPALDRAEVRRK